MRLGDRFGRYVIEGLLGAGGMGEVYRAYDEVLHRRVALKVLRADREGIDDAGAGVRRVLREARMAASLDHPNVVAIHDVGEHEGTSFLVMELVNGRSLRTLVGADVASSERLRWLADAARALAAAHRAGLVHRDVKPENVLLRDDGVIKVLDFGIARATVLGASHAAAGPVPTGVSPAAWTGGARDGESSVAGTPAYMAPEQIRGESLDARVDQFAWGVMAYELLTGHLPWTCDAATLLTAVLTQAPPPLDPSSMGVTPAVTLSISRAMRKRREERFASMEELLVSMGLAAASEATASAVIAHLPATSSPELASAPTEMATRSAGSLAVPARSTTPSRVRKARVAVALAGATAAIGVTSWFALRPHDGARVAHAPAPATAAPAALAAPLVFRPVEVHRLTFDTGCEEFPALTPDGHVVVFDATFGDDTHLVALDLATGARRTLTHEAGWQYAAQVSPDGTRVAYFADSHGDRGTYLVPLDGSAPPQRIRSGGARPTWTPDGKGLWTRTDAGAARIEVASGEVTRELPAPETGRLIRVNELADGRVLGFVLNDDNLASLGLFEYTALGTAAPFVATSMDEAFAVTRDGSQVLFSKVLPTDQVELWHVGSKGGTASSVGENAVQPTKGLSIAGDRIVWSTCRTQTLLSVLRSTPAKKQELHAESLFPLSEWEDLGSVGIPGDASRLVVLSNRTGRRQPWVVGVAGSPEARMLPTGELEPANLAVSPDGHWLAFEALGRGICVIPLDGSAPPRALTLGIADRSPTFSHDGGTLYFETAGTSGRRAIGALAVTAGPETRPRIVLDGAVQPAASPVDDRLAYVEQVAEGDGGRPRLLDVATGSSRPLSPALGPNAHPGMAWSPDGSRFAIADGPQRIVEVDSARGTVLRRYSGPDTIDGMTYLGPDIVTVRGIWGGDLWAARDASADASPAGAP
jgi:serine/threonine-protein kinase